MEFVQGIDWLGWIPQLGEHTVTFALMLGMTYVFLWITVPVFAKYYDKIHLPFGIKFERDQLADTVLHQASSDAVVVQGIYEAGENLEFQAREQMRRVMTRVINKYMSDNIHSPVYQDYLSRARLTISNAIADNHIVYSLTRDKVTEYVENKQIQVIDSISVDISQDPHAIAMLNELTKEFVGQILSVQKRMCSEKIASYKKAFQLLQLEGNKALCQSKIDKNEGYLAAMKDLEHTHEYKSAVLKRIDDISRMPGGAELIEQNINNTLKILDQLEEEGKLDGPVKSSSIVMMLAKKDSNRKKSRTSKKEQTNTAEEDT